MKKSRLTKILVEGNREFLSRLARQVEETVQVEMQREPKTGLVMLKARDSVSRESFYVTEVLVTDCTVSIGGIFGIGTIMGEELERAYQIAVVDAAFNARIKVTDGWISELEEEERKITEKHLTQHAMAANSRVQFDTMEDYNDKS